MSKFNFNIDINNDNDTTLSKSSYSNTKSQMQEYTINKYLVDLGLPSGTLWFKYNLGVNIDKLEDDWYLYDETHWYGKYYAWGEKSKKKDFSWDSYKYGKSSRQLTKYCVDKQYGLNGFVDNIHTLQLEDDVAYQNLHIEKLKFKIPTKEQFEELLKYTTCEEVQLFQYNPDVYGKLFKGYNGKELFLPTAGYCDYDGLNDSSNVGCYWTSTVDDEVSCSAWNLYFDSNHLHMSASNRNYGYSIRPVLIQ